MPREAPAQGKCLIPGIFTDHSEAGTVRGRRGRSRASEPGDNHREHRESHSFSHVQIGYHEDRTTMETVTIESIPILIGREDDGRWWADIELMPGVMAYGATRDSAIAVVRARALRVPADCIDHAGNR